MIASDSKSALELARRGAALLYRHGARRVWLFGSVAKGRHPDAKSDLDFAVEGLPPDLFYRMVSELDQLLHCPVDLVEMETVPPSLRAEIIRHRVLLPCED